MKEQDMVKVKELVKVTVGETERPVPAGSEGMVVSVHSQPGWYAFEFPVGTPNDPVIVSLHESQVEQLREVGFPTPFRSSVCGP